MRAIDLFSGIGGFALGFEYAGIETVAFCEQDKKCQALLAKRFPGIRIYDDVRSFDGTQFRGSIDIVCGGYPCQPFSSAGKRQGTSDNRWLGPEIVRIAVDAGARYIVAENVVGHLSLGYSDMAALLESSGFAVQTFDIPSSAVDLPTVERHIWIIAEACCIRQQRQWEKSHKNCKMQLLQFPRTDKRDYGRWNLPSARVCGVGERIPGRMDRLKQLGNAVPPDITYLIGKVLVEHNKLGGKDETV
jgi:DNA (cytosine-5)-methyltransferase 1